MYQTGLSKARIYFGPFNICVANFICFRALIFKRWALCISEVSHIKKKSTLHRDWTPKNLTKVVLKMLRHLKKLLSLSWIGWKYHRSVISTSELVHSNAKELCRITEPQNMLSWKGPGRKKASWRVKKNVIWMILAIF